MTNLSNIKLPQDLRQQVKDMQKYVSAYTANRGKPPIRVLVTAKTYGKLTEKAKAVRTGIGAAFDGRLEVDGIPLEIISNG